MIWVRLLSSKAEITQKRAVFSFPCRNATRLVMLSALLFLSFSFLDRRGHFFPLNRGLCCVRVLSVAVGVRGYLC